MGDEEVDGLAAGQLDRHVPVRLRGQPEDVELGGGVPVRRRGRRRVVGQHGARHVLPEEVLEGADVVDGDRVLRVDDQAVLAREQAEAVGVVATGLRAGGADDAVVVEVEAGRDAGVGRRDVVVGVVDRCGAVLADREVVVAEQLGRLAVLGVVELVDQDDVRVGALDRLRGAGRLRVARRGQVRDQLARGAAVERGVEGGEADLRRLAGLGGGCLARARGGGGGQGGSAESGDGEGRDGGEGEAGGP